MSASIAGWFATPRAALVPLLSCAPSDAVDAVEVVAALLLVAEPAGVVGLVPVDPVDAVLWFARAVPEFEGASPWLAVAVEDP